MRKPFRLKDKFCLHCGKTFSPTCGVAKFCSAKCRDTDYREKNREHLKDLAKKHYHSNLEKSRQEERLKHWKHREKRKEYYCKRYQKNKNTFEHKKKTKERMDRYRTKKENQLKDIARSAVIKAVNRGKLFRPEECSECKNKCVPQAHHDDYSKPLQVRWLCRGCHMNFHSQKKQNAYREELLKQAGI